MFYVKKSPREAHGNRRADGGHIDTSLLKIPCCQQPPQNNGRRLRGFCFFRLFNGLYMNIRVHSFSFVFHNYLQIKVLATFPHLDG